MPIQNTIKNYATRLIFLGSMLYAPIGSPHSIIPAEINHNRTERVIESKDLIDELIKEYPALKKRYLRFESHLTTSKKLYAQMNNFDLETDTLKFVNSLRILNPSVEFTPFSYESYANEVISDNFIIATAFKESSMNPHARSSKGAQGYTQFMEGRWSDIMGSDTRITDPVLNLVAARKSFRVDYDKLVERYDEFTMLTIPQQRDILSAAHNAGYSRIERILDKTLQETGLFYLDMKRIPKETRRHIAVVDGLLAKVEPVYATHNPKTTTINSRLASHREEKPYHNLMPHYISDTYLSP